MATCRLVATIVTASVCAVTGSGVARADVAGINLGAPVWDGVPADAALQAAIATGAHYVRVNFRLDKWSSPDDTTRYGGKTWFEVYDHVVDSIVAEGLEPYGLLNDELTHGFDRTSWNGAAFEDAYAANAALVIDHFKDRVRVFETLNEPNDWAGGTSARFPAATFARVHARVWDEVRTKHDGDACFAVALVTGPLFSFDDNSSADYLEATILAGRAGGRWATIRSALGHDPVDGVGYHLYVAQASGAPSSDVRVKGGANLDAISAVTSKYGIPGKTWVSEIGWKVPDVDEATQAARLDAMYATLGARTDVQSLMWFTIQDFPGNDWGLFKASGFAPADARPSHARMIAAAIAHAPELAAKAKLALPSSVIVGGSIDATVTVTNLGKSTWTRGAQVRLGAASGCPSAYATNALTWGPLAADVGYAKSSTDARVFLDAGDSIKQGETKVFHVALKAPSTPGRHRFAARMVEEGVAWFGSTAFADVDVTTAAIDAGPDAAVADSAATDAAPDSAFDDSGDASTSSDASLDASLEDGSTATPPGDLSSSGGCGCVDARARPGSATSMALASVALLTLARRRAARGSDRRA